MASGTPPLQRTGLPGILGLIVTVVLLLLMGFWRMFAHFPGYDDEGYILLTVRSYLEHGGLYGKVYSQYGPAFYVLLDGLQRLTGAVIDHGFARWFTLVLWFGGAGCAGAVVGRATGSRPMAWFAWVTGFLYLYQLSEEAFHPGAVVVFVLPATVWVMLELIRRDLVGWAAVVGGAGAALLGLLKVNVGVLFAAGCALWMLFTSINRWPGRGLRVAGVAGGVLFAAILMHGLIERAWVQTFLVLLAAGLTGLGAIIRPRRSIGYRHALAVVSGAAGVVAIVAIAVLNRGTTVPALLEGVILGPMRHADAYSFAVDWRPGTLVLALASMVALAGHRWLEARGRSTAAERFLVGLRLAQILGLLVVVALLGQFRVIGVLFSYALPWLWVWVVPLQGKPGNGVDRDARELTACVLIMQALHAYPVGGIQICWGSFLLFALVAMAVPETGWWLDQQRWTRFRAGVGLSCLLVLTTGAKAGAMAWEFRATYAAHTDLGLPGTGGMRLSEREAATYQILVTNSVLHADMLFSLPGMFSFNLWSELPTPTLRNTTLWYSLLSGPEQAAIIQALENSRRPGIVVDLALVSILQSSGAPPTGPLYSYLLANYRPAFGLRGLGFWLRSGRTIAPVGTAWLVRGADREGEFRVCLLGTGEPVESMEITDPDGHSKERLVLDGHNARVSLQPAGLDGSPQAASREAAWPLQFNGLVWLTVRCGDLRARPPEQTWMLALKSRDNRRTGVALFVDAK